MPPKPQGDAPLTLAQRQARHHARRVAEAAATAAERDRYRDALALIASARTVREARRIAAEAINKERNA